MKIDKQYLSMGMAVLKKAPLIFGKKDSVVKAFHKLPKNARKQAEKAQKKLDKCSKRAEQQERRQVVWKKSRQGLKVATRAVSLIGKRYF